MLKQLSLNITLHGDGVETLSNFKYLGSMIATDNPF